MPVTKIKFYLGVSNLIGLFQRCFFFFDGVVFAYPEGRIFLLEVTIKGKAHRFIGVYAPTTEGSGWIYFCESIRL